MSDAPNAQRMTSLLKQKPATAFCEKLIFSSFENSLTYEITRNKRKGNEQRSAERNIKAKFWLKTEIRFLAKTVPEFNDCAEIN